MGAVVASVYDGFVELPIAYNYPVQNFAHYSRFGVSPRAAVLWRYQLFLNRAFRQFGLDMERCQKMNDRLDSAEHFISSVETEYPKILGRDELWIQSLRRKLKLGVRLRKTLGIAKDSDAYVWNRYETVSLVIPSKRQ